jgi:L-threonylcarbamoyladenylate synthase
LVPGSLVLGIFTSMDFQPDIEACLKVLNVGGIILYPTDTIWGLGCDATDDVAVEKIYELKRRPGSKAMIVLLADEKDLLKYVADPDPAIFDFLENLDKPTTVVYDNAIHLSDSLVGDDGSAAIRIVKDDFCKQLIKRFRKPLVSTSANITGEDSPTCFREITETIRNGVDYIVQYRRDDTQPGSSSSIVKRNKDGTFTIIRA